MSAFTLFDLAYRVARELGFLQEGTATGGSQTTTIDTVNLLNVFEDDFFNAGTIFIIYDSAGAGAAPQGEFARVTDFVKVTGVITHATLTVAVAAGDRYAACNKEYPLDTIIQQINSALSEIEIPTVDTTSLDTVENQTEYTLPIGLLNASLKVWIQSNVVTGNNRWVLFHDWYIAETATGTAKKLIFRSQPPTTYDIKLEYWLSHPPLYVKTDKMNEMIDINRIVAEAALKCLFWKNDPIPTIKLNELTNRVSMLRSRCQLKRPDRKLATLGIVDNF